MDHKPNWKRFAAHPSAGYSNINSLDDGCLMHIFSFLSPIPDRFNTALVCQRWLFLACHPRLWLRVDRTVVNNDLSQSSRVFPNIEAAVDAARPGDTILIGAGGSHQTSNIQIKKPLCLIGGGEVPDDTTLRCSRGSDSALEFLSTCKLANLTVKAELGCCLLHRRGRLIIEDCILQCESNPLDYLSYAIVTTAADGADNNSVSVSQTRIQGGAKAVLTSGTLALHRVRAMYAKSSVVFWFDVDQRRNVHLDGQAQKVRQKESSMDECEEIARMFKQVKKCNLKGYCRGIKNEDCLDEVKMS